MPPPLYMEQTADIATGAADRTVLLKTQPGDMLVSACLGPSSVMPTSARAWVLPPACSVMSCPCSDVMTAEPDDMTGCCAGL
jgi:hypothetical protein